MPWKLPPRRKSIACAHTTTTGSRWARWGPWEGRRRLNLGRNICGSCSDRVNVAGSRGEEEERADVLKELINNGQERGQAVFPLLYLLPLAVEVAGAGEPTSGENKVTTYFIEKVHIERNAWMRPSRMILSASPERGERGWRGRRRGGWI